MDGHRDLVARIRAALLTHPGIRDVEPIGSRAVGTFVPLSDWDFKVDTVDFGTVSTELPVLVSGLEPVAQQWDPLSPHCCYMLILAGPTKVDLLFLDQPHSPKPPWEPSAETLTAMDQHFWDWTLWLAAKQQAGKGELVRRELAKMVEHLLAPMGVQESPGSLESTVASYREARDRLETELGVSVGRRLEREVLPVLPRRSQTL